MSNRYHLRSLTLALAALVLCAAPAAAQQSRVYREGSHWIQETTGTLPAASSLSVRLGFGSVNVQGGNNPNINYKLRVRGRGDEASSRSQFEQVRFTTNKAGDTVYLDLQTIGGMRSNYMGADLTVLVPRSMDLVRAFTRGGNESITGINGRVEVNTAGGNLHLDDIGGAVSGTSGGGNVDIGSVGADVAIKTGGGNVRINNAKGRINTATGGGNIVIGAATQGVSAQTGGGEIDVKQCGGELTAQTGGGSLDLGAVGGRATLQSGGGSIRLTSAGGPVVANTGGGGIELYGLTQGAQVQTGGGQITAEFLGGNFSGSSLQTPSGDIIVYLGANLKATVRASIEFANGHRIRSDFAEIKVTSEGGQYGPKTTYAEGNLNGGGPVLRVRTTNGDIEFRRAKK